MSNRKLASIQNIVELIPITGKDKIVLATLCNGWKVIVSKDNYKLYDIVVYFEIDSILPDIPVFEFLKKRSNNMRIRTMKMGGVISQGLCITIPEAQTVAKELGTVLPENLKLNDDLTEVLKVGKYEEDEINRTTTPKYNKFEKFMMKFGWYRILDKMFIHRKGPAATWPQIGLSKTDEDRWQTMTDKIAEWKEHGLTFDKTVKMDGQSATFILKRNTGWFKPTYEFMVCSRNARLNPSDATKQAFFDTAKKYKIEELLISFVEDTAKHILKDAEWVAIQGEQCGPKIQSNRIGLTENKLYVFNIKYKIANDPVTKSINPEVYKKYMYDFSNLETVPYLGNELLPDDFDKDSFGYYDESKKLLREGVVYRNYEHGISFKAVSPEYLAKHGC